MNKKQSTLRPFLAPMIIYLIGVAAYAITISYYDRNIIIRNIDERLLYAAQNVKYILPDDFHDRTLNNEAISDSENTRNTVKRISGKMTFPNIGKNIPKLQQNLNLLSNQILPPLNHPKIGGAHSEAPSYVNRHMEDKSIWLVPT
jgi:hypothetical protein